MATSTPRSALSPENLGLLEAVARLGSMAAAAREVGMVPSALTYRIRQVEDALDVLLFDRSARRAVLTPAGAELLRSGQYLLNELDAVAQRVKRVATGWEPQFTIAADAIIARATLFELCEAFYAERAPTRLKLRAETLSGTVEALQSGQADIALGVPSEMTLSEFQSAPMGALQFVYAVAPHHPLASVTHSLSDEDMREHRAVAVADSTQRGRGVTHNLLPGQRFPAAAAGAAFHQCRATGRQNGAATQPHAARGLCLAPAPQHGRHRACAALVARPPAKPENARCPAAQPPPDLTSTRPAFASRAATVGDTPNRNT